MSIERKGADAFLGEYAFLHFSITNPYPISIARIKVDAKTISPGRSVPWGRAELVEEVSGGIEPGETRRFKVRWGTIYPGNLLTPQTPTDAVLDINVIGVSGPNGEALLGDTSRS